MQSDRDVIADKIAAILTRAPDPDVAALCERLRGHQWFVHHHGDEPGRYYQRDTPHEAADRLESLSRQLEASKSISQQHFESWVHARMELDKHAARMGTAYGALKSENATLKRERDELRAAVSAARAEIKSRSEMAYEQKDGDVGQGLGEAWRVIDKHIPVEHTEGGKP